MARLIMRGVSFKEFAKNLIREVANDKLQDGAAILAYYLTLAIFPAILFILALIPYLHIPNLQQAIMTGLQRAMPGEAATMFGGVVSDITQNQRGGLLSFGILFAIWTASSGISAVMTQLNTTYDVREGRPYWKVQLIALGLTFAFAVLTIAAFALTVVGGNLQGHLADIWHWGTALRRLTSILRWLVSFAFLVLSFEIMYYFGPDVQDQKFKFISPGSAFGAILFLLASYGFKAYVAHFGNYGAMYGSIGAVIVLMLWLYISGFVLLLGSEINALIEHFSSDGKLKGEKVPTPPKTLAEVHSLDRQREKREKGAK